MATGQKGNLPIVMSGDSDEEETKSVETEEKFEGTDALKLIKLFNKEITDEIDGLSANINIDKTTVTLVGDASVVQKTRKHLEDLLGRLYSDTVLIEDSSKMDIDNNSVLVVKDPVDAHRYTVTGRTQKEVNDVLDELKRQDMTASSADKENESETQNSVDVNDVEKTTKMTGETGQTRRKDRFKDEGKEEMNRVRASPEDESKSKSYENKRGPDKYSFTTAERLTVRLYKGSIVKQRVDVIVNAANDKLDNCGGVAKVISEAAGYELEKECQQYIRNNRRLNVSQNCITGAGKLPCKFVIHAVGPNWHDYKDDPDVKVTCLQDLSETVKNILIRAEKYQCATVVMPPISSGIFGVPHSACAAMYLKGIMEFSGPGRFRIPQEVHIIDIKDEILDIIEKTHRAMLWNPEEINPQRVLEMLNKEKNRSQGTDDRQGSARSQKKSSPYGRHCDKSDSYGACSRNSRGKLEDRQECLGNQSYDFKESFKGRNGHKRDKESLKDQRDDKSSASSRQDKQHGLPRNQNQQGVTEAKPRGNTAIFYIGHAKIYIYTADIVRLTDIDGLVSAESPYFNGSGRLASSILNAAGQKYKTHYKKLALPNGKRRTMNKVLVTPAGNLAYKRVFHAVTAQLSDRQTPSDGELNNLAELVFLTLKKADELVFTWKVWEIIRPESVAMPLLGAGALKVEKDIKMCCEAVLDGVFQFFDRSWIWKINEVHLVNLNPVFTKCLQEVFESWFSANTTVQRNQKLAVPAVEGQKVGYMEKQKGNPPPHLRGDQRKKSEKDVRSHAPHVKPSGNQPTGERVCDQQKGAKSSQDGSSNDTWSAPRGGRRGQRQFGQGRSRNNDKENEKDVESKAKRFDPSKYRYKETWRPDEGTLDEETFEKYLKPLRKRKATNEERNPVKTADTAKPSGNLNIIDDDDEVDDVASPNSNPEKSDIDDDEEEEDCVVCMSPMDDPVQLIKCKHAFCRDCIVGYFRMKTACPVCGFVYGELYGDQPVSGVAKVYEDAEPLPGYKCPTIIISYEFRDGKQEECHPEPGMPYKGISRQGYLPADDEGKKVLRLLERAFKQRLTFTIGSSRTSGKENVVTWNDIHHKTRRDGGPQKFGYPDEEYLSRVKDELLAKGIE